MVASGPGAELEAAGAGGQGEERGEQAAARRQADPFTLAASDRLGGSVVDDILVVSEDEGEEARRIVVEGGQGQPLAPNVPAAAMKSILPECGGRRRAGVGGDRQERERQRAGTAEHAQEGGRRVARDRKGRRGCQGPGMRHGRGMEGKGGKGQGRQWPQPQHLFKQQPPGSPPQVSAAVRAEQEREAAARRRRGSRRWRTWSASAVAARPRSRGQTPSTGWRWRQVGEDRSDRVGRRSQEGGTAANPVTDHREQKGRQGRAAKQQRDATASRREGKIVGASEVGRHAQCRAGVQGWEKGARTGTVDKVRKG